MRRDLLALATQLVVDDGGEELGLAGRSFQVAFMEILDGVEEADEEEAHEEEAHEEAAHEDAARAESHAVSQQARSIIQMRIRKRRLSRCRG